MICTSCRHNLPLTNFHIDKNDHIKKVFYGRANIAEGTALFWFIKRGIVQQLIHNLKYRGQENIGTLLGDWLGEELKQTEHYSAIDIVIPVPLHHKKLKTRGYNQVAKFGQSLAQCLDAEYSDDVLVKLTNTISQVHKKRLARWQDKNEVFTAQNLKAIEGKHILLVDDIITTGATMEACYNELNKAKNIKISIATMAIA
ncbi:ComF family protein [Lacinutrix salivirga]